MIDQRLKELQDMVENSQSLKDDERKTLMGAINLLKKETTNLMETEQTKTSKGLLDFFRNLEASHPELTKAIDHICLSLSGAGL